MCVGRMEAERWAFLRLHSVPAFPKRKQGGYSSWLYSYSKIIALRMPVWKDTYFRLSLCYVVGGKAEVDHWFEYVKLLYFITMNVSSQFKPAMP